MRQPHDVFNEVRVDTFHHGVRIHASAAVNRQTLLAHLGLPRLLLRAALEAGEGLRVAVLVLRICPEVPEALEREVRALDGVRFETLAQLRHEILLRLPIRVRLLDTLLQRVINLRALVRVIIAHAVVEFLPLGVELVIVVLQRAMHRALVALVLRHGGIRRSFGGRIAFDIRLGRVVSSHSRSGHDVAQRMAAVILLGIPFGPVRRKRGISRVHLSLSTFHSIMRVDESVQVRHLVGRHVIRQVSQANGAQHLARRSVAKIAQPVLDGADPARVVVRLLFHRSPELVPDSERMIRSEVLLHVVIGIVQ